MSDSTLALIIAWFFFKVLCFNNVVNYAEKLLRQSDSLACCSLCNLGGEGRILFCINNLCSLQTDNPLCHDMEQTLAQPVNLTPVGLPGCSLKIYAITFSLLKQKMN